MTAYQTLHVTPSATHEEIKAAYRRLAMMHHPDAGGDHAVFCAITEAWSILGDPKRRQVYDAEIAMTKQPCPACSGQGRTYKQKGFTARIEVRCPKCQGSGLSS